MGSIKIIGKYNLKKNEWYTPASKDKKLTSLSLVSYNKSNNDKNINYLIIVDGCRVENYTNDPYKISDRKGNIKYVLKYFKKRNLNTEIKLLLVDKDAPLKEQAIKLANIIDNLYEKNNVNSINIIGVSKGGLISFDSIKYLKNKENKTKTNIIACSSPYLGTLMASPIYLESKLNEHINRKFIVRKMMNRYYKVNSNSHMDYDISIKNGIPKECLNRYDKTFIEKIFSDKNIESINKINSYKNITTLINRKVLLNAILRFDFLDIGLCILNKILFDGKGDGFVPLESSSSISEKTNIKSEIYYSTHRIIKKGKNLNKILGIVENNML